MSPAEYSELISLFIGSVSACAFVLGVTITGGFR